MTLNLDETSKEGKIERVEKRRKEIQSDQG